MINIKIDKQLFKNTVMLYLLKIVTIIFPLLTFPYLTRILGKSVYGQLTLSLSVITYLKVLIEFGLGLFGINEASKHREDSNFLSNLFTNISMTRFLFLIISSIVLLTLISFGEMFEANKLLLALSFLQLIPLVFGSDFIFYGQEKMSVLTIRTIVANAIYTVIILIFVKDPEGVYLVPLASFASSLFVFISSYMYMAKKFNVKFIFKKRYNVFSLVKIGSPFFIASLSSIVFTTGNIFVLGLLNFEASKIGVFSVATNLVIFIRSFFAPISDSLYPYMVKNKDFKLVKYVIIILMPLVILGCIILFIFSEKFITIFSGEEYLEASLIFKLYIPLILITLPTYLLGFPTLGALGKLSSVNKTAMLAAIIHVLSIAVLNIAGILTIETLTITTVISESLILLQRLILIYKYKKMGQITHENKNLFF